MCALAYSLRLSDLPEDHRAVFPIVLAGNQLLIRYCRSTAAPPSPRLMPIGRSAASLRPARGTVVTSVSLSRLERESFHRLAKSIRSKLVKAIDQSPSSPPMSCFDTRRCKIRRGRDHNSERSKRLSNDVRVGGTPSPASPSSEMSSALGVQWSDPSSNRARTAANEARMSRWRERNSADDPRPRSASARYSAATSYLAARSKCKVVRLTKRVQRHALCLRGGQSLRLQR